MANTPALNLVRISVRGVVQGVGFRPFVYQLATRHNLRGWVCNTSEAVRIEVEGIPKDIDAFISGLKTEAPPLSRIESLEVTAGDPAGYDSFEIRDSVAEAGKYQLVSPDIATCTDCRREIFDPADRRYRYPFTNCTNCGPRFTIITDIPYDRPNTTMLKFGMCPDCRREYENPLDRRFHAQPNACPACGPKLELLDTQGKAVPCDDILRTTSELLKNGQIIAVKGLGGFLLACDATNEAAVNRLRERKNRPAKPFAVMLASIDEVNRHCTVSQQEIDLLQSPGSPIVLVPWQREAGIVAAIAPNLNYLGVMLPYTPLHHLLLVETGLPLVMTSGNLSEEPIARDNDEAVRRLNGIADYFLVHDRDIYSRYDDSVMTVERGEPRYARRARGSAPYPIKLPVPARQILACGAEEKNAFCLTKDNYAFVSQHIGDMENLETLEHFTDTIELYKKLFRVEPELIAGDMHPEYLPTKYAKEQAEQTGLPFVPVQHHHAHIASCLADNGISDRVIGVSFDGTGYGTDGHIWGGEFLVADYAGFTRAAHLEYLPLPGGAQAIRKPYRAALGYLTALGIDSRLPFLHDISDEERDIILHQLERGLNTPLPSSMGRLFDVVAAIIGVRGIIQYEAQAAIDLETVATAAPDEKGTYPFATDTGDGITVIRVRDLLAAVIDDLQAGISQPVIAARFHETIASMISSLCQSISTQTGLTGVALSGGVFQNRLLTRKTVRKLESAGFTVYTHRQVPCNDGGISLGQAVIANAVKEALS
ncbi:MAG: carbamoyltransferase HypF [Dehalococcoidales bacterium]|nr:carbamoyltransferase HypF [Dehalococcoidales bacterium]